MLVSVNSGSNGDFVVFNQNFLNNVITIEPEEDIQILTKPNEGYDLDEDHVRNNSTCRNGDNIDITGDFITITGVINNCNVNIAFKQKAYLINIIETSENGSYTVPRNLNINHGGDLVIETTPNDGYVPTISTGFCQIYSYVNGNKIHLENIRESCDIEIDFQPNYYWVEIQAGDNSNQGTYSLSENGSSSPINVPNLIYYFHNENMTITAVPNDPKYHVSASGDCNPTVNETTNTITLNNIQKSCTMQIGFTLKRYFVSVKNNAPNLGGYKVPSGLSVNRPRHLSLSKSLSTDNHDLVFADNTEEPVLAVDHGVPFVITGEPNVGYHSAFSVSSGSCHNLTLDVNRANVSSATSNCHLALDFVINKYRVVINNNNSTKGNYSLNPTVDLEQISYNTGFVINAAPNNPNADRATISSVGSCSTSKIANNQFQVSQVIGNDCVINLGFEDIKYEVTLERGNGFDKGTYSPPANLEFNFDEVLTIQTTPNAGYHLLVSGSCNPTKEGNTVKATIQANCSVAIGFDINKYGVTIQNAEGSENGSFSSSTSSNLNYGENLLIETTPNEGYRPTVSSNCRFTLDGNFILFEKIDQACDISIGFVPDDTYAIHILDGEGSEHGTYTRPTNLNIARGESLSIMATPANGYRPHVTGTCDIALDGNEIKLNNVYQNCSIIIGFVLSNSYLVSIPNNPNHLGNGIYEIPENLNVNNDGMLIIPTDPVKGYHPVTTGSCNSTVNENNEVVLVKPTLNCTLFIDFEINQYNITVAGSAVDDYISVNNGKYKKPNSTITHGEGFDIETKDVTKGYHPVLKGENQCPHIKNRNSLVIQVTDVQNNCSIDIEFVLNQYIIQPLIEPKDAGSVQLMTGNQARLSKSNLVFGDDEANQNLFFENIEHGSELQFLIKTNPTYKATDVIPLGNCENGIFDSKTNIFTVTATDDCSLNVIFDMDNNNNNNNNNNIKPIPTLSQWSLILLIMLMVLMMIKKPIYLKRK